MQSIWVDLATHPLVGVSSALVIAVNLRYMYVILRRNEPPNPLPFLLLMGWVVLNNLTYREFVPSFLAFYTKLQVWTILSVNVVVLWKTRALGLTKVRTLIAFNRWDVIVAVIVPIMWMLWQMRLPVLGNWIGQIAGFLSFVPIMKQAWTSQAPMDP
ncbi:MAG: hypothetical protein UY81_C0005G0006 [Candidatus Giovannonibacteria bacterium GW2011_GWA2_53_7]|uniref:Uncharacterized protein n=1 Tax=Candidatus Giovannonibacteria bacterium GW2011_GWA2_53_7 TaxID=1618650 RepID=A0A0G1Y1G1_9BACT|nr:MAG: hypothetical protein UY81_C0005G0006 [Candidatus Giovannonibacteria bacterium GW2011_GWA2_53_7]